MNHSIKHGHPPTIIEGEGPQVSSGEWRRRKGIYLKIKAYMQNKILKEKRKVLKSYISNEAKFNKFFHDEDSWQKDQFLWTVFMYYTANTQEVKLG